MEHFPAPLSRRQSDALIETIEARLEAHRYGLWALEARASGELVGFTGLASPEFDAPVTPTIEIGWRLARAAWGNGCRRTTSEPARAVPICVGRLFVEAFSGLSALKSFNEGVRQGTPALDRR